MSEGAAVGRYDRELAISEARSSGYSAGIAWNRRPASTEDLHQAMWLGACAALFGVCVGAFIRVWLDESRAAVASAADPVELAGATLGERWTGELNAHDQADEEEAAP